MQLKNSDGEVMSVRGPYIQIIMHKRAGKADAKSYKKQTKNNNSANYLTKGPEKRRERETVENNVMVGLNALVELWVGAEGAPRPGTTAPQTHSHPNRPEPRSNPSPSYVSATSRCASCCHHRN